MKKHIFPKKSGLSLSKRTISNLTAVEMNKQIGGVRTVHGHTCGFGSRCGSSYAVLEK